MLFEPKEIPPLHCKYSKNEAYLGAFQIENFKDLSSVKNGFKSVPPQLYFEISGLGSAKKWCKIQNMTEEERF